MFGKKEGTRVFALSNYPALVIIDNLEPFRKDSGNHIPLSMYCMRRGGVRMALEPKKRRQTHSCHVPAFLIVSGNRVPGSMYCIRERVLCMTKGTLKEHHAASKTMHYTKAGCRLPGFTAIGYTIGLNN